MLEVELNTSLADAVAAIGSTPAHLVISNDCSISADLSIDDTIAVHFRNGAKVSVASGKTLTIGHLVDHGSIQCIDLVDDTAEVRFGTATVRIDTSWITGAAGTGGDIEYALNQALASCDDNDSGSIYIPAGTWTTTGNHAIPSYTNIFGAGKGLTVISNADPTHSTFKIGEQVFHVSLNHMQIKSTPGPSASGSAVLLTGNAPNGCSDIDIKSCILTSHRYGLRIYALDADSAWQAANVRVDADSFFQANDWGFHCNTPNTNVRIQCRIQANWIPAHEMDAAYGQYLGEMSASGPLTLDGEFGGAGGAYGTWQAQTQVIASGNAISSPGTVTAAFSAAHMTNSAGTLGGTENVVVNLNTSHDTAAKIAAAIRDELSKNVPLFNAFHLTYSDPANGGNGRDISLIYLDALANDSTGSFTLTGGGGIAGFTDQTTNHRTDGVVNQKPFGFKFTGSHYGATFIGTADEGINDLIINEANEITSGFVFINSLIQGPIRCDEPCSVKIFGGLAVDKVVRDGAGTAGSPQLVDIGLDIEPVENFAVAPWQTTGPLIEGHVYEIIEIVGDDDFTPSGASENEPQVVFTANGTAPTWADGSTLSDRSFVSGVYRLQKIVNPRSHNFIGSPFISDQTGVLGLSLDTLQEVVQSGYLWEFIQTYDGYATQDPAKGIVNIIGAYSPGNSKPLLSLGNGTAMGVSATRYNFKRYVTGDMIGYLAIEAMQDDPYRGIYHNGPMHAQGFLSDSSTRGMGYVERAGGTVTQSSSKSTAVTLNTVTGEVTMNNAALADATNVTFTLINSSVLPNDVPYVVHKSGGTAGAYQMWISAVSPSQTSGPLIVGHIYTITNYVAGDVFTTAGAPADATGVVFTATSTSVTWGNGSTLTDMSFKITLRNVSGGSLSEAIVHSVQP